MKVLVLGGGGREHALAWRLRADPAVREVHCAPGNPGIEAVATCHPGTDPRDPAAVTALAASIHADLVVVGPEEPLVRGVADALTAAGRRVFGPTQRAAEIESSKTFAKALLARCGIPTAQYAAFDAWLEAERFIRRHGAPLVVKADGLFAGKGVVIAETTEQALTAARDMLAEGMYGAAGRRIVIEEFMTGPELSMICLADGCDVLTLAPSQDHKKAYDGDCGPNTGGMGAYSPVPLCPPELAAQVERDVLRPVIEALAEDGREYRGTLYAGLMLTAAGLRVLEFNARLGDPEAQVILPRLRGPFAHVLLAAAEGDLGPVRRAISWDERAAACVVMASPGYPGSYPKGIELGGLAEAEAEAEAGAEPGARAQPQASGGDVVIFHAGTARDPQGRLVTSGGRVLGVTALAHGLPRAVDLAYRAVRKVRFPGAHFRRDIGVKAIMGGGLSGR
ncbi:MAG: phosphoribosylamine--glycine ligase [Bacillota bacterium]|nr:phosphoribosylamine--glycine ligase [Bacillota bacterium]